jgi:hypothetical protein
MCSADYAAEAAKCEAQAASARTSGERKVLLEEAVMWRRLALQASTESMARSLLQEEDEPQAGPPREA